MSFNLMAQPRPGHGIDDPTAPDYPADPSKEDLDFNDHLVKLQEQINANWRKCISKEAPAPAHILDAHAQLKYLMGPAEDECDPKQRKKVLCVLDKKVRKELSDLKKMSLKDQIVREPVTGESSMKASELIESLDEMTKKPKKKK
jgi:hypothetical protein